MKILITGGCGFLGSNLARRAIERGDDLLIFDNCSRLGSAINLSWLKSQSAIRFVPGDIRDQSLVERTVRDFRPEIIFHNAGQVAMTTSIGNPRMDFEINAGGTLNVLEAVRLHAPGAMVVYSSTNKVFGDLNQYAYRETQTRYVCPERPDGFDESTPLSHQSPYGCSKGAADQYVLDWHRTYGIRTVVFRHSSMYGHRQFATADQGWIGWFCKQAQLAGNDHSHRFTISGSGKQVRDVLHADDMVELYYSVIDRMDEVAGEAFCIGGGMANSLSLLELFQVLQQVTGTTLLWEHLPARSSDQQVFVADISKATRLLGWKPAVGYRTGIAAMMDWITEQSGDDGRA